MMSSLCLFLVDNVLFYYLEVLTIRFIQYTFLETLTYEILLSDICCEDFVLVYMIESMLTTSFIDLLLLLGIQIKMLNRFRVNFNTSTHVWNGIDDLSYYSGSFKRT